MKVNGTIEAQRIYPSPNPHVDLKEISYWSEGIVVKGLLATPKKIVENIEGLLYLRGGIQSIGMVRPARIAQIAMQGFIVFAPYYRGNRGAQGKDEFGGIDRYDAIVAVDVLKQFIQVLKVHLFAFSRGGLMALWTAILRQDIASIVTWGGVSDIILTYEERVDMRRMMKRLYGGSPMSNEKVFIERNPILYVANVHCPVYIIHGEKDYNVSIEHAYRLEKSLLSYEKEVETHYYEQYTHFFPSKMNRQVMNDALLWMKQQR